MKSMMTSLLYRSSQACTSIGVRLAVDLETGEYATYLNFKDGDPQDDERGHYFMFEDAPHLAHKVATDDFFQRLTTGT